MNSGVFLRNKWLNLCIDIGSFAAVLSKNAKPVKLVDSLAISGGELKIRKILAVRNQIPLEVQPNQSGTLHSPLGMHDDIFENGVKIESLPKSFDFQPATPKVNQVIRADQFTKRACSIDESVTTNDCLPIFLTRDTRNNDKSSAFSSASKMGKRESIESSGRLRSRVLEEEKPEFFVGGSHLTAKSTAYSLHSQNSKRPFQSLHNQSQHSFRKRQPSVDPEPQMGRLHPTPLQTPS